MGRSLWRCRNSACPVPHGAVLGRVTAEGGLALDPSIACFQLHFDTRRATIWCPCCGRPRDFRGEAIISGHVPRAE